MGLPCVFPVQASQSVSQWERQVGPYKLGTLLFVIASMGKNDMSYLLGKGSLEVVQHAIIDNIGNYV